jgi:N-acetylmuramoyl-L-alanine amidase
MELKDGILLKSGVPVEQNRAFDIRGNFAEGNPTVFCLHYGAGTQESDVAILTRADKHYVSAHFSVSREGHIIQMVSSDMVALHNGDGKRRSVTQNLNYTSIGVEMENWGWLDQWDSTHAWRSPKFGATPRIPLSECYGPAKHPLGRLGFEACWHSYTEDQVDATLELALACVTGIPTMDRIVGHDEVSVHKQDPGPAFNMDEFIDIIDTVTTITQAVEGRLIRGFDW